METNIFIINGYRLLFIIVWLVIGFYVDWRMYVANKYFYKLLDKQQGTPYIDDREYGDRFIRNIFVIFLPIYLIIVLIYYGIIILSHKRSIFNGELLE